MSKVKPWTPQLHVWLQDHHGIVALPTLVRFGCERRDAYRLVEHGEFELMMPGVFRSLHWPKTAEALMAAACARHPLVTVCGATAGAMWHFRGLPKSDEVTVCVPHPHTLTLPGTVLRRTRALPPRGHRSTRRRHPAHQPAPNPVRLRRHPRRAALGIHPRATHQ